MGGLLLVAVIIGALVASGIGGKIADHAAQAICAIAGQGCTATASASTTEDGAARPARRAHAARQRLGRRDRGARGAGPGRASTAAISTRRAG